MRKYTIAGIVLIIVLALRSLGQLGMALNLFSGHLLAALFYLVLAGVYIYALIQIVSRNPNGVMITMAVAVVDLVAILIDSRNFYGFGAAVIDLVLLYFAWKEYKNQGESVSAGTGAPPPAQ